MFKDIGSDFRDGKITSSFIYLIENSGGDEIEKLKNYIANQSKDGWEEIKNQLNESGAIDYSVKLATHYVEIALDILKEFPDSDYKKILFDLSHFLVNRNY